MDSIAQTRVVTSMPIKTKVDLVARALRPKTCISNDEGAQDLSRTQFHLWRLWGDARSFVQLNLLSVREFTWLSTIRILRAMAGHLSGGPRARPGGRRARPGGHVATEVQSILGGVTSRSGAQRVLSSSCISNFQKVKISSLGCSYSEHFSKKGARKVHRLLVVDVAVEDASGLLALYSRGAA